MVNQKLAGWIKSQLEKGKQKEEISQTLSSAGWQDEAIEKAFNFILKPQSQSPLPPPQTPTTFLGPTKLLSQAFKIYKKRFKTLIGISFARIIASFLVTALTALILFLNFSFILSKYITPFYSKTPSVPSLPSLSTSIIGITSIIFALFLFLIANPLIYILEQTSLIYAIKAKERIGIKEAFARGSRVIFPYLGVAILLGLIVFGAYWLFIIPGVIFSVWFSLAFFVLISENLRGMDALLKSREYVKGKWGGVLGRLLFVNIILLVLYFLVSFIIESLNLGLIETFVNILLSLAVLLWPSFVLVYTYCLYTNLKSLRGDFEFAPSRKKKAGFIIPGVLGILIFLILLFSAFFFVKRGLFDFPPPKPSYPSPMQTVLPQSYPSQFWL